MKKLEHNLQVQIIQYLKYKNIFCFAVPNGGSRNKLEGANLKKEGVLAGVSDLIIIKKNRIIFIELKYGKNKQQESQKLFETIIKANGFEYYVIYNLEELIKVIGE